MEELIYLLVKLIVGAMSNSKAKQPQPIDRAWQQRVWEQQRRMQQAALGGSRVPPPPPLPELRRAAPVQPVQAVKPVQPVDVKWVEIERASRRDAGRGRTSQWSALVKPASLRRRFILTEVLRPPVSLRPPRM